MIYITKRLQPQLQAEYCMGMIAQAIIFNAVMLWVSVDMSTPPLANMRFTIINDIHILAFLPSGGRQKFHPLNSGS